jgi:hypothetical protein
MKRGMISLHATLSHHFLELQQHFL